MKEFNDMTTTEQWLVSTLVGYLLEKRPDLFKDLVDCIIPDEIKITVLDNDITEISITKLRHKIMKERGMLPPKPKKIKVPVEREEEDLTTMENIPLLPKMLYIQEKYKVRVVFDIFVGSLTDVCIRYHWEIDRSTISRWRKYMRQFILGR